MCLDKYLMEKDPLTDRESKLIEALLGLKKEVDTQTIQNPKRKRKPYRADGNTIGN
jgi:hypothetical protein